VFENLSLAKVGAMRQREAPMKIQRFRWWEPLKKRLIQMVE